MSKWRELSEGEKPQRGNEIRIPGDKQPLGVVIKVGPSGITYRPHGGGALQTLSVSADVEVRAGASDGAGEGTAKKAEETDETTTKPKKSKAASVKPKSETKQLEIVEEPTETEKEDEEETENGETNENENEDAGAPAPATTVKGWMHIDEFVAKSNVPLGRILKARREGAFTGMVKPDPAYTGVGRKPLIYSPAALKVAMGLTGGRASTGTTRRGRPPGTGKSGSRVSESSSEKPARAASQTIPPRRHINQAATAPAQSHLYSAGEKLQETLEGIDAEIARLTELRARIAELWSFFEV